MVTGLFQEGQLKGIIANKIAAKKAMIWQYLLSVILNKSKVSIIPRIPTISRGTRYRPTRAIRNRITMY
jgi:hypothetical protein